MNMKQIKEDFRKSNAEDKDRADKKYEEKKKQIYKDYEEKKKILNDIS
ncbi:hypothetical protein ABEW03_21075 [Virgibacillus pantothenticus]